MPSLDKLRFGMRAVQAEISDVFAALVNLRTVDSTLSSSKFSHLSDVCLTFVIITADKKELTSFGDLIGVEAFSDGAALDFRPDDALPIDAYKIPDVSLLDPEWLEDFLRERAEGALPQLLRRDILEIEVHVEINYDDSDDDEDVEMNFGDEDEDDADDVGDVDMISNLYEED